MVARTTRKTKQPTAVKGPAKTTGSAKSSGKAAAGNPARGRTSANKAAAKTAARKTAAKKAPSRKTAKTKIDPGASPEAQNKALSAQLAQANKRIRELEDLNKSIADRIDWVIDSLKDIDGV